MTWTTRRHDNSHDEILELTRRNNGVQSYRAERHGTDNHSGIILQSITDRYLSVRSFQRYGKENSNFVLPGPVNHAVETCLMPLTASKGQPLASAPIATAAQNVADEGSRESWSIPESVLNVRQPRSVPNRPSCTSYSEFGREVAGTIIFTIASRIWLTRAPRHR